MEEFSTNSTAQLLAKNGDDNQADNEEDVIANTMESNF